MNPNQIKKKQKEEGINRNILLLSDRPECAVVLLLATDALFVQFAGHSTVSNKTPTTHTIKQQQIKQRKKKEQKPIQHRIQYILYA